MEATQGVKASTVGCVTVAPATSWCNVWLLDNVFRQKGAPLVQGLGIGQGSGHICIAENSYSGAMCRSCVSICTTAGAKWDLDNSGVTLRRPCPWPLAQGRRPSRWIWDSGSSGPFSCTLCVFGGGGSYYPLPLVRSTLKSQNLTGTTPTAVLTRVLFFAGGGQGGGGQRALAYAGPNCCCASEEAKRSRRGDHSHYGGHWPTQGMDASAMDGEGRISVLFPRDALYFTLASGWLWTRTDAPQRGLDPWAWGGRASGTSKDGCPTGSGVSWKRWQKGSGRRCNMPSLSNGLQGVRVGRRRPTRGRRRGMWGGRGS